MPEKVSRVEEFTKFRDSLLKSDVYGHGFSSSPSVIISDALGQSEAARIQSSLSRTYYKDRSKHLNNSLSSIDYATKQGICTIKQAEALKQVVLLKALVNEYLVQFSRPTSQNDLTVELRTKLGDRIISPHESDKRPEQRLKKEFENFYSKTLPAIATGLLEGQDVEKIINDNPFLNGIVKNSQNALNGLFVVPQARIVVGRTISGSMNSSQLHLLYNLTNFGESERQISNHRLSRTLLDGIALESAKKASSPSMLPLEWQKSKQNGFAHLIERSKEQKTFEALSAKQKVAIFEKLATASIQSEKVQFDLAQLQLLRVILEEELAAPERKQKLGQKLEFLFEKVSQAADVNNYGKELRKQITGFLELDLPSVAKRIIAGENLSAIVAGNGLLRFLTADRIDFKDFKKDSEPPPEELLLLQRAKLMSFYRSNGNYEMVASLGEAILADEIKGASNKIPLWRKKQLERAAEEEIAKSEARHQTKLASEIRVALVQERYRRLELEEIFEDRQHPFDKPKELAFAKGKSDTGKLLLDSKECLPGVSLSTRLFSPRGLTGAKLEIWQQYEDCHNPRSLLFRLKDESWDGVVNEVFINAPLIIASGAVASLGRAVVARGSMAAIDAGSEFVLGVGARELIGRSLTRRMLGPGVQLTKDSLEWMGEMALARSPAFRTLSQVLGMTVEGTFFEAAHLGLQSEWLLNLPDWAERIVWSSLTLGLMKGAGKFSERAFRTGSEPSAELTQLGVWTKKISNSAVRSIAETLLVKGHVEAAAMICMGALQNAASGDLERFMKEFGDELFHAYVTMGSLKLGHGAVSGIAAKPKVKSPLPKEAADLPERTPQAEEVPRAEKEPVSEASKPPTPLEIPKKDKATGTEEELELRLRTARPSDQAAILREYPIEAKSSEAMQVGLKYRLGDLISFASLEQIIDFADAAAIDPTYVQRDIIKFIEQRRFKVENGEFENAIIRLQPPVELLCKIAREEIARGGELGATAVIAKASPQAREVLLPEIVRDIALSLGNFESSHMSQAQSYSRALEMAVAFGLKAEDIEWTKQHGDTEQMTNADRRERARSVGARVHFQLIVDYGGLGLDVKSTTKLSNFFSLTPEQLHRGAVEQSLRIIRMDPSPEAIERVQRTLKVAGYEGNPALATMFETLAVDRIAENGNGQLVERLGKLFGVSNLRNSAIAIERARMLLAQLPESREMHFPSFGGHKIPPQRVAMAPEKGLRLLDGFKIPDADAEGFFNRVAELGGALAIGEHLPSNPRAKPQYETMVERWVSELRNGTASKDSRRALSNLLETGEEISWRHIETLLTASPEVRFRAMQVISPARSARGKLELLRFLTDPNVSSAEKHQVVDGLFNGTGSIGGNISYDYVFKSWYDNQGGLGGQINWGDLEFPLSILTDVPSAVVRNAAMSPLSGIMRLTPSQNYRGANTRIPKAAFLTALSLAERGLSLDRIGEMFDAVKKSSRDTEALLAALARFEFADMKRAYSYSHLGELALGAETSLLPGFARTINNLSITSREDVRAVTDSLRRFNLLFECVAIWGVEERVSKKYTSGTSTVSPELTLKALETLSDNTSISATELNRRTAQILGQTVQALFPSNPITTEQVDKVTEFWGEITPLLIYRGRYPSLKDYLGEMLSHMDSPERWKEWRRKASKEGQEVQQFGFTDKTQEIWEKDVAKDLGEVTLRSGGLDQVPIRIRRFLYETVVRDEHIAAGSNVTPAKLAIQKILSTSLKSSIENPDDPASSFSQENLQASRKNVESIASNIDTIVLSAGTDKLKISLALLTGELTANAKVKGAIQALKPYLSAAEFGEVQKKLQQREKVEEEARRNNETIRPISATELLPYEYRARLSNRLSTLNAERESAEKALKGKVPPEVLSDQKQLFEFRRGLGGALDILSIAGITPSEIATNSISIGKGSLPINEVIERTRRALGGTAFEGNLASIPAMFQAVSATKGRERLAILFTDDPRFMFQAGNYPKGSGSCQNWENGSYAQALLGYVGDFTTKSVWIINLDKINPEYRKIIDTVGLVEAMKHVPATEVLEASVGRSIVKLVKDRSQRNGVFIEPTYTSENKANIAYDTLIDNFINQEISKPISGQTLRTGNQKVVTISGSRSPEGQYEDGRTGSGAAAAANVRHGSYTMRVRVVLQ